MSEGLKPKPYFHDPFKEPLIDSGVDKENGKIKTFENNSEVFVKEIPMKDNNPSKVLDGYSAARRMCKKVCAKYDFAIPDVNYVIGKSSPEKRKESENSIYQIKERIHGFELNNLGANNLSKKEIPKFLEDAEKTIIAMLQYILDTSKTGGLWMHDIFHGRQWAYGTKAGETEKKMYLLDVDDFTPYGFPQEFYLEEVFEMASMLKNIEGNFGGKKLEEGRKKFLEVIELMFAKEELYEELKKQAIKFLDPEK